MAAGLLLTGGASRRFGAPKADVRVDGDRLADRSARVLTAVASPVIEVGPGVTELPAILEDPPGSGPLAALVAGGRALAARGSADDDVLVVAVDMPFVDEAVLRGLLVADPADAVVPRVDGRAQPLCARYSRSAITRATVLVRDGTRAMHALLDVLQVEWLDEPQWSTFATARSFVDIDTPEDAHRVGIEPPG